MTTTRFPEIPESISLAERPGIGAGNIVLYAAAIFVGALLLFLVQPIIARFILPWFGGAPSTWTACMLFFQLGLLGGYLYAHLSIRWLTPRAQATVHIVLLGGALMMLPIIPADTWKPAPGGNPTWRILLLLSVCVGGPYLVLSSTGPLLQAWLARLRPGRAPYRLYALSNAGSLLALLAYPVVLEPLMSRRAQAGLWTVGLFAYAVLSALCAARAARAARVGTTPGAVAAQGVQTDGPGPTQPHRVPWSTGVLWLVLPACASLLLLAVTNKICQDVAVVPLLWIVPLALYLVSFIICFDSPAWYRRGIFVPAIILALAVECLVLFVGPDLPILAQIAIHATTLWICCMICHGELYRLRPPGGQLTAFYLAIAAGGALGSAFVSLVAPLLFDSFAELQIGLGLCYALIVLMTAMRRGDGDEGGAVASGRAGRARVRRRGAAWPYLIAPGLVFAYFLSASVNAVPRGSRLIVRDRNFFGTIRVYEKGDPLIRYLEHGGITHGIQVPGNDLRYAPLAYYQYPSGIALAVESLEQSRAGLRIGVVGLGAGTMAAFGRAGDTMRFYEINPQIVQVAQEQFTYLSDTSATVQIVLGDARLSLESEPSQQFDLMAIDAFSGDSIPMHLLTRQAMAVYLRHLKPGGVLALNITNRHIDIEPVVRALAADAGLGAVCIAHQTGPYPAPWEYGSRWMLLTNSASFLQSRLVRAAAAPPEVRADLPLWTDEFSSIWRVLK